MEEPAQAPAFQHGTVGDDGRAAVQARIQAAQGAYGHLDRQVLAEIGAALGLRSARTSSFRCRPSVVGSAGGSHEPRTSVAEAPTSYALEEAACPELNASRSWPRRAGSAVPITRQPSWVGRSPRGSRPCALAHC